MANYDPVGMLRVLTEHGAKFVIVGGVGARLQGAPLITQDLDVTPEPSPENLRAISAALTELGARLRSPSDPDGVATALEPEVLASATVWTLTTSMGDLDLVFEPAGTGGFADLRTDADQLQVATNPPLSVLVASLADIIRSKQAAGRAKDLASLPLLRQTLAEIEGAKQPRI